MAKLFSSNIDFAKFTTPQPPKETVVQGQAVLKPQQPIQQQSQNLDKRDLFGRTISMADRYSQYREIGSNAHLPEFILSEYNTGMMQKIVQTQQKLAISIDRNKVDLFGTTISSENRSKQFRNIGSTSHLAEYFVSNYNTRNYRDPFGKTIKLADRFKQYSEITSTSHLPEYILSDQNTGYVNRLLGNQRAGGRFVDQAVALTVLKNAGVFKEVNKNYAFAKVEQGSVSLNKFPFVSILGNQERSINLTSTREYQKNKITIPNIVPTKTESGDRTFNPNIVIIKIDYNKVSVVNNNLILGVTVVPTLELRKLAKSVLVNPKIPIKLTSGKSLITNPNIDTKRPELLRLDERALPTLPRVYVIGNQYLTIPDTTPTNPRRINLTLQAEGIIITLTQPILRPLDRHGSSNITGLSNVPDEYLTIPDLRISNVVTITPDSVSYNINPPRLETIVFPEIRHGTTTNRPREYYVDEFLVNSLAYAEGGMVYSIGLNELLFNPILNQQYISEYNPYTSIGTPMGPQDLSYYYGTPPRFPIQSTEGGNFSPGEVRPTFSDGRNPSNYGVLYDETLKYTVAQAQVDSPLKVAAENSSTGTLVRQNSNNATLQSYSPTQPLIAPNIASDWISQHGTGTTTLINDYKTLSYPEIAATRTSTNRSRKDFTVNTPDDLDVWRERLGMPSDGGGDTLMSSGTATGRDFVKVKIGNVQFRAYITSFSDSYSPSYTDVNYVGRPDTLKVYKNSTRNISLAFKVAAFSNLDLKGMYEKMELLIKSGTMATAIGEYARGPMLKLTVGGWVVNAPIVISSLKFDTNPSEYTWDIIQEVPHIVDVSLDCVVLSANGGSIPFLSSGTYIQYGASD